MVQRVVPLLLLVALPAQVAELRTRLLAAAKDANDEKLRQLATEALPPALLVDTLSDPAFEGHLLPRALHYLLTRGPDGVNGALEQLWRAEPEARRRRGRVFAHDPGLLCRWHARGEARDRADAEAIAPLLPYLGSLVELLHRDDGRQRESAKALLRSHDRQPDPEQVQWAKALERVGGTAEDCQQQATAFARAGNSESATTVRLLLQSEDPRVRARACVIVHHRLGDGRALPLRLRLQLLEDPVLEIRHASRIAPLQQRLRHSPVLQPGDFEAWLESPVMPLATAQKARLGRALLQLARQPHEPPALRTESFGMAAGLSPELFATVLGIAVADVDADVAQAALRAASGRVTAAAVPACEPMVLQLLENASAAQRPSVLNLAGNVLALGPAPELREAIVQRGLRALAGDPAALAFVPPLMMCTGGEPPGGPATLAAQELAVAAETGDRRLVAPLLALLEKLASAVPVDLHAYFLLDCLGNLLPAFDVAASDRLHGWIGKALAPQANPNGVPRLASAGIRLLQELWLALYPRVSDPVAAACDPAALAAGHLWSRHRLVRTFEALTPARAKLLLGERRPDLEGAWLWQAAPELLVAAWQRPQWREAAAQVLGLHLSRGPGNVRRLLATGTLTGPCLAGAMGHVHPAGLPALAALADAVESIGLAGKEQRLASLIQYATRGEPVADFTALQALAARGGPVGVAAARRALDHGDTGRRLADEVLAGVLRSEDTETLRMALRLVLEGRLDSPALPEAMATAERSSEWEVRVFAFALRVARGERAITDLPPFSYPAAVAGWSGTDVDAATLKEILGDRARVELYRLVYTPCSPVTQCSGLALAAELPDWDDRLLGFVTISLQHVDPRVRRAACLALASREPLFEPKALLVHLAAYDPDPLVRAPLR